MFIRLPMVVNTAQELCKYVLSCLVYGIMAKKSVLVQYSFSFFQQFGIAPPLSVI